MSPDYARIKSYYDKKWATKAQLQQYVSFGKITKDEYKLITGEDYPVQ